jgi:hypothetical protein
MNPCHIPTSAMNKGEALQVPTSTRHIWESGYITSIAYFGEKNNSCVVDFSIGQVSPAKLVARFMLQTRF